MQWSTVRRHLLAVCAGDQHTTTSLPENGDQILICQHTETTTATSTTRCMPHPKCPSPRIGRQLQGETMAALSLSGQSAVQLSPEGPGARPRPGAAVLHATPTQIGGQQAPKITIGCQQRNAARRMTCGGRFWICMPRRFGLACRDGQLSPEARVPTGRPADPQLHLVCPQDDLCSGSPHFAALNLSRRPAGRQPHSVTRAPAAVTTRPPWLAFAAPTC